MNGFTGTQLTNNVRYPPMFSTPLLSYYFMNAGVMTKVHVHSILQCITYHLQMPLYSCHNGCDRDRVDGDG